MNLLSSLQSLGFLDDSLSSISLDEGSIGSVFTTTPGSVSASGAVDDEGLSKSETGVGETGDWNGGIDDLSAEGGDRE